nr:hypothetical protein [Pseudodesulfovibrio sp.]
MRTGKIIAFVAILFSAVSQAATTFQDVDATVEPITSLDQIADVAKNTQEQFWQLVPPTSDDPFYLHPDKTVRAVDWKSKDWPKTVLKQMYAEMGTAGLSRSMYPFYKLTVIETRTGELVYYNSYDQEIWRTPSPIGYNEYLFAFECYEVDSLADLTLQQQIFGRSSNIGTEVLLLPVDFIESYEEDVALESQAIAELSASMSLMSAPLAMGMSSGIELQMDIDRLTNGTVEVFVEWLSSLNSDSLDLFLCSDLIAADWQLQTNFPTASSTNFYFSDQNTNQTTRFYVTGTDFDEDFDGLTSAKERFLHKTREDLWDTSGDGLGDGWLVQYGFNPLALNTLGDGDNDGFSNLEEQLNGTDPTSPQSNSNTGTVATIRYHYDEDDRLTDFYSSSEVAQKIILTASHNIAEEVSAN